MSARLDDTPTIRRMTLSDLDSVIAIEREVFLFPWTRGNFSDSVNAGYHCLVLDQEGHLFGYGVMTVAACAYAQHCHRVPGEGVGRAVVAAFHPNRRGRARAFDIPGRARVQSGCSPAI